MGRKTKTRIVARVDGTDREIFSIRQRSDGSLVILRRSEKRHQSGIPVSQEEAEAGLLVLKDHISVHRSFQSVVGAVTVKHTVITEDASVATNVALVKNRHGNLLWPVQSKLCANLRDPRYDLKLKSADRIVRIAGDVPAADTLILHLFVLGKSRAAPEIGPWIKYEIEFDHFRVAAYVGFINIPSTNFAIHARMPSRPPQRNGLLNSELVEHYLRKYPDGAEPMTDEVLPRLIYDISHMLAGSAMQFLLSITPDEGGIHSRLRTHRWNFSRYPASTTVGLTLLEAPPPALSNPPIMLWPKDHFGADEA